MRPRLVYEIADYRFLQVRAQGKFAHPQEQSEYLRDCPGERKKIVWRFSLLRVLFRKSEKYHPFPRITQCPRAKSDNSHTLRVGVPKNSHRHTKPTIKSKISSCHIPKLWNHDLTAGYRGAIR